MSEAELIAAQRRNRGLFNLPVGVRLTRLSDGRAVIYPWPRPLNVGCILSDSVMEMRLRSMMRRWLWAAVPVFIIFGLMGPRELISAALLYVAAYYGRVLVATRGLPRTREQSALGWRRHIDSGQAHNVG
jgi:hypothetical protein